MLLPYGGWAPQKTSLDSGGEWSRRVNSNKRLDPSRVQGVRSMSEWIEGDFGPNKRGSKILQRM